MAIWILQRAASLLNAIAKRLAHNCLPTGQPCNLTVRGYSHANRRKGVDVLLEHIAEQAQEEQHRQKLSIDFAAHTTQSHFNSQVGVWDIVLFNHFQLIR